MLSGFKGKGPEKDHHAAASSPAIPSYITAAGAPSQRSAIEPPAGRPEPTPRPELLTKPAAKPETISSIGASMSIVGHVVCTGQARVFGRIEGELRASDLLLGEGAQVEGVVVSQEVTVRGHVKGTIRAVRVRLEDGATVEGDIYHRSLSIEEGAVFEGSSRRVENPTEAPVNIPEEIPQEASMQSVLEPQPAANGAGLPAANGAGPHAADGTGLQATDGAGPQAA
jgi:cytoskeletal protein CcmA (bactofilin family)